MAEGFATVAVPRLPIEIDFGVDSLTLGGATLTAVRSRIENASTGWSIGALDLRGPGTTFVHAAGTLAAADKTGFKGPVTVDLTDPAAFLAWIDGGRAASRPALGPMRISGTVTLRRTVSLLMGSAPISIASSSKGTSIIASRRRLAVAA